MALAPRFAAQLEALGLARPDVHLLVAVSGGCDSVVLLHLLRFAAGGASPRLSVAHFDHAMRAASAADAHWVAGVCRAWDIPLHAGRAEAALRTEAEARRARYAFLRSAARHAGATHLATAHHADDQAETVLFRILRGTGLEGLRGMAAAGPGGLVRPLLPFWRSEIEAYARRAGLRWRPDPTNLSLAPARNRIRRDLLPRIERTLAPAARRNLVHLAELAGEAESGWDAVTDALVARLAQVDVDAVLLARTPLHEYHPALRARLLRRLLRRFGIAPSRVGTRMAVQFITDAPSGRELRLPGGVRISTEFDQARIERLVEPMADEALVVDGPAPAGTGELRVGGWRFTVSWNRHCPRAEAAGGAELGSAAFALEALRFPLVFRGWAHGDRIRLRGGSRRVKKLFADHRIPVSARSRTPVLVDRDGTVLWVAGVVQAPALQPQPGQEALWFTIMHARAL